MKATRCIPLVLLALTAACDGGPTSSRRAVSVEFTFQSAAEGWTGGFADYPAGEEEFYELATGMRSLPAPLDTTRKALYISGNNHSDDLFMFLKREVTGLAPNTRHRVRFEVKFASNAGEGCMGVGGAPGEGVVVKGGAYATEPTTVIGADGWYRMSVDKGQQTVGSTSAAVLGHVGAGSACDMSSFHLKTLDNAAAPVEVTSDASGRLWLLVGTDSGFEATTTLYYTSIKAELEEVM